MIIACLIISSSLIFGLSFIKAFKLKLYFLELFFLSFVSGIVLYSFLNIFLTLLFNYQFSLIACTLLSWITLAYQKKLPIQIIKFSKKITFSALAIILLTVLILGPLFNSRMFLKKNNSYFSGGSAWGDMALHASYIHKFANQEKFEITNPLYAQQKSNYPFLINYYTALFIKGKLSLQMSLVILGVALSVSSVALLFFLVLRISKSISAATISLILFFFNGGLGFYYFFLDLFSSKKTLWQFVNKLPNNYTHFEEVNIFWSNIIVDYLLPQRGFLIGLAIFLVCLNLLYHFFKNKNLKKQRLIFVSLLIALLPLFHPHSFLSLSVIYFWFLIIDIFKKRKIKPYQILSVLILLSFSLPQIYWLKSNTLDSHFSELNYGWLKGEETLPIFWIKNMGLALFFLVFGNFVYLTKKKTNAFIRSLIIPATGIFAVSNLIAFQPNIYDNMKLMLYSWLITSITAAILLNNILKKSKLIFAAFILILSFSGFLSLLREYQVSWPIALKTEIQISEKIKKITPNNSIFLTADNHNHPVVMLAGRSIIMGYRGWLWTHGIDYSQTEKDVHTMFQGKESAKILLEKYKINYVYIGPSEKDRFEANTNYYENNYEKILSQNNIQIYKIN